MSIYEPTRKVIIGGQDLTAYVSSFSCTDQDMIQGLGKFSVKFAEEYMNAPSDSAVIASLFPAYPETGLWKLAQFYVNGKLIFSGMAEKVQFDFQKGDTITISGYCMGVESQNLEFSLDYANPAGKTVFNKNYLGMPADALIYDIIVNGGQTFNLMAYPTPAFHAPPFPAAAATPGKFQDKSLYDIIKEAGSFIGYAARTTETLTSGKGTFQFHSVSPLASVDPAPIISNVVLRSCFDPTKGQGLNNIKSGTATRDLHDAKNYLKIDGAGAGGSDPRLDGLTGPASAPAWTSLNAATITNDASDLPPFAANGELVDSAETVLAQIVAGGTNTRPETMYFTFTGAAPYQIRDPAGNYLLNLLFNRKTDLHFWVKVRTSDSKNTALVLSQNGNSPQWNFAGIVLTDKAGLTARWLNTSKMPLALFNYGHAPPWCEFTIPLPTSDDVTGQPNQEYAFSDVGIGSISAFNLSAVKTLAITAAPEDDTVEHDSITYFALDDVYFVCTPYYEIGDISGANSAGMLWGKRDTRTSAQGFTQQVDLQSYGDGLLKSMKCPMLRMNPLTCIVDPKSAFITSGASLQVDIPRWSFPKGTPQYWRVLCVQRDWSPSKGYVETVDIIPATAT